MEIRGDFMTFMLMLLTMILSLVFFVSLPFAHLSFLHMLLMVGMMIIFVVGLFKVKTAKGKWLLGLSTIYYLLMSVNASSLWILIPLTLIPLLTANILNYQGLLNRMAMAFWIVVFALIMKTIYLPVSGYVMTLIVLVSYYLQTTTIFMTETGVINLQEMSWYNVKERNPNIDYFNSSQFSKNQ